MNKTEEKINYNVLSLDKETGEIKQISSPVSSENSIEEKVEKVKKNKEEKTLNSNNINVSEYSEYLKIKASKARISEGFLSNFLASYKAQKGIIPLFTKEIAPSIANKVLLYIPDSIKNPIETAKNLLKESNNEINVFQEKMKDIGSYIDDSTLKIESISKNEFKDLLEQSQINIPDDNYLIATIQKDKTLLNDMSTKVIKREDNQSIEDFIQTIKDNSNKANVIFTSINSQDYQDLKQEHKGKKEEFVNKLIENYPPVLIKNKDDDNILYSSEFIQPKLQLKEVQVTEIKEDHIFDKSKIDFDKLSELGYSKEVLENNGILDTLLKGNRTDLLDFVHTADGANYHFMGKMKLVEDPVTKRVNFNVLGVSPKVTIPDKIGDYELSPADKKILEKTGNLFKPVTIEGKQFLVGLDKEIKSIVIKEIDKIKLKDMSDDDVNKIKNGGITEKKIYYDVAQEDMKTATTKLINEIEKIQQINIKVEQPPNKIPAIHKNETSETKVQKKGRKL